MGPKTAGSISSSTGKSLPFRKWTTAECEDIYERRQSGERWHSIEKVGGRAGLEHLTVLMSMQDYPNRTANAITREIFSKSVSLLLNAR